MINKRTTACGKLRFRTRRIAAQGYVDTVEQWGAGNKVASWECANKVINGVSECDMREV